MVSDFADKRDLLDRERKRDRLADDLLEDAVDDADADDETVEELGGAPAAGTADESGEEPAVAPRIASRTAIDLEEWGEPAVVKLEEEAERETATLELEEGIDDPVRMYLREIGKVSLLTAANEKTLARSMEEGDYIQRIENRFFEETGRRARGADVLTALLNDLYTLSKPLNFITKDLKLQKLSLAELIADGRFRALVDAEIDEEMAQKLTARMKGDEGAAAHQLVQISIVTHILTPELLSVASKAAAGEKNLLPPPERLADKLSAQEETIKAHFQRLKEEGFRAEKRLTEANLRLVVSVAKKYIGRGMEIAPDKVREIIKVSQEPVSLETPIGEEEDSHLGDFIEDQGTMAPSEAASHQLLKEQVQDVVASLTPREQKVLILRFGLEDGRSRTLEEVGREFNVTRERIRQIEAKALRKLRHPSRSKKLKDYLE